MRTCLKSVGILRTLPASLAAAAAALLLPAAWAAAAPLTNGNFEAAANADSATNTFPGWTESAPSTPPTTGNTAIRATTALAGSTSALLTGTGGQIGTLSQGVDAIGAGGPFNLALSFAAVDPGAGNRAFQLLLTGQNGSQLNLIVVPGTTAGQGSIQVFGGNPTQVFNTIATQANLVNFSTSLASPVVNTLAINGTVGGGYTVSTNGNTSGSVNFYQNGGVNTSPNNFNTLSFTTVNGTTVNYVVDNVTLVPEPAAAGVFAAAAAVAGLARRRRRSA